MKKIAVCIPSYNESENIVNITKQIDEALTVLDGNYISYIVNADNNSPDQTNKLFSKVVTKHQKISLLNDKKGKGINVISFFKWACEKQIDYAFTIDADLKSFKQNWLSLMLNKLENGDDFVLPLYYRRKEEGNTTNHFIVPILYAIYGKFIRQPIGGDYAFNMHFMQSVLKENISNYVLQYGIDIFLVINAIVKNFHISQVFLGEKIHGLSYHKMLDIFEGVVNGFIESYRILPPQKSNKEVIKYEIFKQNEQAWEYKDEFKKIYRDYLQDISYDAAEILWYNTLEKFIANVSNDNIEEMKRNFILRVYTFWNEVDKEKDLCWENRIIDCCKKVGE